MPQVPKVPVNVVAAKAGETFSLGPITIRIMEDGSHTDNRIGVAEFVVPPNTSGPPPHWHEMHDETFIVTAGTIRFLVPGEEDIDAHAGDYVVVPIRAPHTFSNPSGEEARFYSTFTPAFYINYFKLLGSMIKDGKPMTPEVTLEAMASFATLPVPKNAV